MPLHEEGVHLGAQAESSYYSCIACFNKEVAKGAGISFETPTFSPVTLVDAQGDSHVFHFLTRLCPAGVIIEAYEVIDGTRAGYDFRYLCENPLVESLHLLQTVLDRANRMLAQKHVTKTTRGSRLTDSKTLKGRIICDPSDANPHGLPAFVIDGTSYSWDEVGKLLLGQGGFQFKFQIKDPVDDIS
jgi:hypothetical protein